MNRVAEFIPYEPIYADQSAQVFLEVFTTPPFNETLSLNDARSQLMADSEHPGFGGILVRSANNIVGFSWWFDITGSELHDRWRSRFTPKDNVPRPQGSGVYLMEFGLLPTIRNRGLGHRLLQATLAEVETSHDWIAVNTHTFAHAGLALLKSHAFEDLGLTGIQVPTRICLIKYVQR